LLAPSALPASPVDWHLGDFFEGVSKIAADVDLLDERVLREKASRDGIETNTLVKILTIVTAVLGSFGAVAGIFGMNVKATVFEGGDLTFAVIIGTVFVTSGGVIIFARIKKWI
jgi:Mg2+ and Co2+ transporter CorA